MKCLGFRIIIAVVSGLLFGPDTAHAESDNNLSNGFYVVGVGQLPEYEGAEEFRTVPFVVSRFNLFDREFEVEGLQARYDLVKDPVWRAGPAISLSIPRTDDAESVRVALLPEVDVAAELGGYVGFRTPLSSLKEGMLSGFLFARRDVAGQHDGWLVTADLEYFFAAARALRFGLSINTTFVDDNYADTYFGISNEASAASGLPSFRAGSGLRDVGIEVFSILSFSERSGLFIRGSLNRYTSNFADSPIVLRGTEIRDS